MGGSVPLRLPAKGGLRPQWRLYLIGRISIECELVHRNGGRSEGRFLPSSASGCSVAVAAFVRHQQVEVQLS